MPLSSYISIDLETTGLAPDVNEIIEIGAVRIHQGKIVDSFSTLVKPLLRVPSFVQQLTGISSKMLVDAPRIEDVIDDLTTFIGLDCFLGHNIAFDIDTLNRVSAKLGRPRFENNALDTQDLAQILYPNMATHKLSILMENLGIPFPNSHRALADATAVADLFHRMMGDLQKLPAFVILEGLSTVKKSALFSVLQHFYSENIIVPTTLSEALIPFKRPLEKARALDFESSLESSFARLKEALPEYEARSIQRKMADFVHTQFEEGRHGIVEGPTGVGKSLAYLIPAALTALKTGRPVVISTKTKTLQNQLETKDIPIVKQIVPGLNQVVVLKGKENYVDVDRVELLMAAYRGQPGFSQGLQEGIPEYLGLLHWLFLTGTGDLMELHPSIYQRFHRQIYFPGFKAVNQKNKGVCFLAQLRKRVKAAQIIITNHAFLFTDLSEQTDILPNFSHAVIDEAHGIEDVATSAFQKSITYKRVVDLLSIFRDKKGSGLLSIFINVLDPIHWQPLADAMATVEPLSKIFFREVFQLFENPQQYTRIVDSELMMSRQWIQMGETKKQFLAALAALIIQGRNIAEVLAAENSKHPFRLELEAIVQKLESLIEDMAFVFSFEPNYSLWLETDPNKSVQMASIHAAPIQCQTLIHQSLLKGRASVLFTSATLSVGGSMQYFVQQIGLTPEHDGYQSLILDSEFDLAKQAVYAQPTDIRNFDDSRDQQDYIARSVFDIVFGTQKRTLVLMTAHKSMKAVYNQLQDRFLSEGTSAYCQTIHGSREAILSRFTADKGPAVIFGVDSFWEGIDLKGNQLECLIIPKLPFPVPSDPIIFARSQAVEAEGKNSFMTYFVPLAVLKFKQGIGRLIRSHQDTGTVFVLDSRMTQKPFGKLFLNELASFGTKKGTLKELIEEAKHFSKET